MRGVGLARRSSTLQLDELAALWGITIRSLHFFLLSFFERFSQDALSVALALIGPSLGHERE
jgi:hypothetical protein